MSERPELLWSILIPTVSRRCRQFLPDLVEHLEKQAAGKPVEVLYLGDNRRMSCGKKCNLLVSMAFGKYISFIADDDWVAADYVDTVLPYLSQDYDVISFDILVQDADKPEENQSSILTFGQEGDKYHGNPMPTSIWLNWKIRHVQFPEWNLMEDAIWTHEANRSIDPKNALRIPKVLYEYRSSSDVSEHRRDWKYGKPDEYVWRDTWGGASSD